MIPDLDLARVRKWIDGRDADMTPEVREQIRYEIDVTTVPSPCSNAGPPGARASAPSGRGSRDLSVPMHEGSQQGMVALLARPPHQVPRIRSGRTPSGAKLNEHNPIKWGQNS